MTQIIRPVRGKIQIRRLPYRPKGGNYDLLKSICGGRTLPEWNGEFKYFEVARAHIGKLIEQLPNEIGRPVEVVLYGAAQTLCVSACWDASPHTVWDCVCSCAGKNHGSGRPLPQRVAPDLSVDTEYTTESYWIRPNA